ncbi:MAG: hypothetical protein AB1Z98_35270 [Nannocystaceae bacterium]
MMTLSSAALVMALAAGPPTPTASAASAREGAPRSLDFELTMKAATPMVTGPTVGPDFAVAFGRRDLHLRLGMQVLGGPERQLTPAGHRVGEVVDAGTVHMCAAKSRRGLRIRLCGGGQLGTTHLRYRGFADPGRRVMPWGALTSFADLSIPLGRRAGLEPDRVGLLLRGGAMVPVLGPAVVMRSVQGPAWVRLPKAVGATFGAGLRFALR